MLGRLLYSKSVLVGRLKGFDLWEVVCVENLFRKQVAIDLCVCGEVGFFVIFLAREMLQRKLESVVLGRGNGCWLGLGFGGSGV